MNIDHNDPLWESNKYEWCKKHGINTDRLKYLNESNGDNTMKSNSILKAGEFLESPNGKYKAIMSF